MTLAQSAPEAGSYGWAHGIAYGVFVLLILVFLALDLGVFHRHAHTVGVKEALRWTGVWISVALLFNVAVYFLYEHHVLGLGLGVPVLGKPGELTTVSGATAAQQFLTGYVVEKSLSMDNIFVIAVIFSSLGIPSQLQHRVLFWGIIGALLMRGVMIALGAALIHNFSWIVYVFGGILILTAIRMAFSHEEHTDPTRSSIVRLTKRIFPVSDTFDGQRFFTRVSGKLVATPMLVALVLIEFTDLIFAVDSIPAIFAITADPFIVFTSNIMAILGLRALFFALAALIRNFRFLKPALVIVLLFVGVKMLLVHTEWKIDTNVSLFVVLGVLALGVIASVIWPVDKVELPETTPGDEPAEQG